MYIGFTLAVVHNRLFKLGLAIFCFNFFSLMEEQGIHNASTTIPSTTLISKSLANAQFLKVVSFTLDLPVLEDNILTEMKV